MTPFRDLDWVMCGVCGEEACGLGYAPDPFSKIMWVCEECRPLARHVYGKLPMMRSEFEQKARDKAGQEAGAYLEGLGKTDLAVLSAEEWDKFLDTLLRTRASELRRLNADLCPPF